MYSKQQLATSSVVE